MKDQTPGVIAGALECLIYPAYAWNLCDQQHFTYYYCAEDKECCQVDGNWYCLNETQSKLGCSFISYWTSLYKTNNDWLTYTPKPTPRCRTGSSSSSFRHTYRFIRPLSKFRGRCNSRYTVKIPRRPYTYTTSIPRTTRPTTSWYRIRHRYRNRNRYTTSKTSTKAVTVAIQYTTRPTTYVYRNKHRYRYRQRYDSKTYTKATIAIPHTTRKPRSSTYSTNSRYRSRNSDTKKTPFIGYILGFGIPLAVVLACFATVHLNATCKDLTSIKKKTSEGMILQNSSTPQLANDIPVYAAACVRLQNGKYDTVIASQRQLAGQFGETDNNDSVYSNTAKFLDGYETESALCSIAGNVHETSEHPENNPTVDPPTYQEARCLNNCLYETSL
ncbi:uncharacterized protein LOC127715807 [Mytilus californianus]|uniref:uncharacterized protein LOC127715807 n=1 Tax=Mytilus californianus TaxID=6549 RepID=UPI0022453AAF|nr:uncharacterized protein LOC127715807 [Mytilus californianus]